MIVIFNLFELVFFFTSENTFSVDCFWQACTHFVFFFSRLYQINLFISFFSVGAEILFDKFWLVPWAFERLGNVYGCGVLVYFAYSNIFLNT